MKIPTLPARSSSSGITPSRWPPRLPPVPVPPAVCKVACAVAETACLDACVAGTSGVGLPLCIVACHEVANRCRAEC